MLAAAHAKGFTHDATRASTMKFALSPEQRAFARSIGDLLRDADTPSVIRSWAARDAAPGLAVWRELAGLGVTALAAPERYGGFGDAVDLAVAFDELGYHAMPGPVVESIAALPMLLAGHDDLAERWLPGLVSGTSVGTLALPPQVPYAVDAGIADVRLCVIDGVLHEFTAGAGALDSVDPARRLYIVDSALIEPLCDCGDDIGKTAAYGVLATAAQLLGLGRRLLDDSVAYAKQRSQYGNPIGSYQAIKHLLADVATQLELAHPLLHGAAVALATSAGTVERDVSAARVACADAAYLAARTGLQVHGAIGYTAEHDLGLWLTKVRALRSAWGTQAFHRARVLDALMAR